MTAYNRKEYRNLLNGSLAMTSFAEQAEGEEARDWTIPTSPQNPHVDYQTSLPGVEYYFLGNGLIQAAIQHGTLPSHGTCLGLLLMHPEHFARKSSTLLYHPESGLERTMLTVIAGDKLYYPTTSTLEVHWEYPAGIPTVVATWRAGRCSVREELWCPIGVPILLRTMRVKNHGSSPIEVQTQAMLYPNQTLFDEEICHVKKGILEARGYLNIQLSAVEEAPANDRWVTDSPRELSKGEEMSTTFVYRIDGSGRRLTKKEVRALRRKTSAYWKGTSEVETGKFLDHFFKTSKNGLKAAVSAKGKLDSAIWQYNLEWIRDQSMVVVGLVMSGQDKLAKTMLDRMMEKMVNDDGVTLESSRWRGFDLYELDQNGELLYAHWVYWNWTNDDSLLKKHWKKIIAVAEFPLRPEFWDSESGLLKSIREYWERSAPYGVRQGFELTYQFWPVLGLEKAAEFADYLRKPALAEKWRDASFKIRHAMLSNPKFALIAEGRFIKRRLMNGEVQTVFEPPDRSAMSPGIPLAIDPVCYCDPDTQEALPIAFEFIQPNSGLARNTMAEIEKLWNQRWDFGGYSRYNVASEADTPGPWPFATLFVARAYLEMGEDEKVWRALHWLKDIQGGKAGSWMETYGARPVPPLPPTSIIPWTWAEHIIFSVHHLLGIRPGRKELTIRPRLLSGMKEVKAKLQMRGKTISLKIRRGRRKVARIHGGKVKLVKRTLTIPFPKEDLNIEMTV